MRYTNNWKDYELLDTSDGERLERWGKYILVRPDPQVVWKDMKNNKLWKTPDAVYSRSKSGGGAWKNNKLPEQWNIRYEKLDLTFVLKPMGFKHTGLFPEQAVNWEKMYDLIKNAGRPIKVLNLFAYTGGATVACAKAGASVVHVDASKGMTLQAKENAKLSGLESAPIRYIVDDCQKFIEREIRRNNKYDAIIMDPPSYGRGPNGEVWKLEECIGDFIKKASCVLSDKPLFFLVNSYTTGLSPAAVGYILNTTLKKRFGGSTELDEIGLKVTQTGEILPCGGSSFYIGEQ
ncbi:MAG: SAM-dependent methyltransferase [Ruminococcaceae bacterium]|nr:SAM-dependent methyltransferase [Oscillospiraceae bacterium]